MKDKLLYLTIGILIGIVVMQWTMPTSRADRVFPPLGVVAIQGNHALDENGQVWEILLRDYNNDFNPHWERKAVFDVTLPVDQIKLWGADTIVTEDNTAWALDFGGTGEWYNCGPWPGGAVPTSPESWGGVKGKYDGKK